MILKKHKILEALHQVYDPEIPVNLVDLGLIYEVEIDERTVRIKMTLTARGCPMHDLISKNVKDAVESLEGVDEAFVEVVWDPKWNPDMISPAGRTALGME